LCVVVDI